ncbi:MAG: TonB-dependent receptor domain-containing protein, partial [Gemmatimonadales bacterium]
SLAVSADVGDQPRADNPGALTASELAANRNQPAALNVSRRAGKDVSQMQAGATLRRQFAGRGEAALTLFGLTRDLENPLPFAYIRIDRVAYGTRLTVTRDLPLAGLPHRLTAGLDFQRLRDDRLNFGNVGGQPDTIRSLDQLEHVTEIGPFVQSAWELSPAAALTTGLRYDRVSFSVGDRLVTADNPDDSGERVMDAVSGSLGATLSGPGGSTLYASVGSTFETPTTTELANRPDTAGGFNAGLEPQRSWSYEVGARGSGDGRVTWSLALFRADVRNLLVSFEIPTSPQRRFFRNAGRARHVGVEVGAAARLGAAVDAALAWTWSDFRYVDYAVSAGGQAVRLDGRALPGIPEHWVRLLARARPGFAGGGWLEIEQTLSSGYRADDVASVRTEPYAVTHVRAGWDGTVGGVRLSPFVGLNNAFNDYHVGSVVINAAAGRYFEPAPGRNVYVGFSLGAAR